MKCSNCGEECDKTYDSLCCRCYTSKVLDSGLEEYFKYIPEVYQQGWLYQQGWVCPKCGGVISPNQPYCLFCYSNNSIPVTITSVWSIDDTNIET